jgi:hypothetical protein
VSPGAHPSSYNSVATTLYPTLVCGGRVYSLYVDDTVVLGRCVQTGTGRSVMIYKLIVIVFLLVILQDNKKCTVHALKLK